MANIQQPARQRRPPRCGYCHGLGHNINRCLEGLNNFIQIFNIKMRNLAYVSIYYGINESTYVMNTLSTLTRNQLIRLGIEYLVLPASRPVLINNLHPIYVRHVRNMIERFNQILGLTRPFLHNNVYVIELDDFMRMEPDIAMQILDAYDYGITQKLFRNYNVNAMRANVNHIRQTLTQPLNDNVTVRPYARVHHPAQPVHKLKSCGVMILDDDEVADFMCAICMDNKPYSDKVDTNCNHSFCGSCMDTCLEISRTPIPCPLCRTTVTTLYMSCVELHNLMHNKYVV